MTDAATGEDEASGRIERPGKDRRRWMLGAYALATLLAFPHELPGGGVLDLGLLTSWAVPFFLILGLEGRTPRAAARAAFVASLLGHALLFHWFFVVTVVYGGMPAALGAASPILPAFYVSIFTALFGSAWAWLDQRGRSGIAVGAALWVSLDLIRADFLGGFPWATLGYGLHLDAPLLGLTRWTGVYGLSFVAAAVGIAAARWRLAPSRASRRGLFWTAAATALAHGLGALLLALGTGGADDVRTLQIAAIQGNVDQGQKWDAARRSSIQAKYLSRSLAAAQAGADWIVWPETAVPGFFELDAEISESLRGLARSEEVVLVVGGMGFEPDPEGLRRGLFFDSAFAIDRAGEWVDRYDKTKLVPFGEFVPLRGLLGHFFKALATGLSTTDVTEGPGARVIKSLGELGAEGPDGSRGELQVGVPICYELLFPRAVRGFAADGADVLLAITNDAWYGRTGAPHQFLAMTALRAAENGLWLVRAANTGVSAVIDDRGRVRERSALFEEATVMSDVPLRAAGPRTLYAQLGDVFAGACLLWTGLGLVQAKRRAAHADTAVSAG